MAAMGGSFDLNAMLQKRNKPSDPSKMRTGKATAEETKVRQDGIAAHFDKSGNKAALSALKKMGYGGPR